MPPLVSILTPSYNQSPWLRDNLKSVQQQGYPNIEHIVMDGGSTDETAEILRTTSDNVRWWSEPDRGQSHALNKAFQASGGDIIGWLNSDDAYVDRRAVEFAVKTFEQHPEVGVVYGHGLLVSRSNRVMQFIWVPAYRSDLLRRQTYFIQPSVFIRRSVLGDFLVDEQLDYVMDRDLWMRLREKTEFQRIPLVVGLDRNQPDRKSLMDDMSTEMTQYEAQHGLDMHDRGETARRKLTKIALRWRGVIDAAGLPDRIDPAIDLDTGSLSRRVANQVFVPRARMSQA